MFRDLDKACLLALADEMRLAAWRFLEKTGLEDSPEAEPLIEALDEWVESADRVFGVEGPSLSVQMPNGEWLPVEAVIHGPNGSMRAIPKAPTEEIFNRD